ncbi:MAG: hypothetical protein PHQ14_00790 [Chromatiales bacterium]|jgi:hypothetical protein|nr:hypothetical protein [Chromatiales bacterium]MDX9767009.1 hypothetical protein [Ectothiorhodospiraceae bacterium]
MAGKQATQAGSVKLKAIGFGVLSVALYGALFVFEDDLLAASTGGGWAFVVPVVVAFVFSYIHGAFTGHFWDALGIQAKK